jgi:hypothetical protein
MKNGHRFVDYDMHIMELIALFDNYLYPAFEHRMTLSQRCVDAAQRRGNVRGRQA